MPSTEAEVGAAIAAIYQRHEQYLRDAGCAGHDAPMRLTRQSHLSSAARAASDVLRPLMTGISHWRMDPQRGESIAAYARRVSRCAAARCAEVGLPAPSAIAHEGAETLGMLTGHVCGHRGVAMVSRIEITHGSSFRELTEEEAAEIDRQIEDDDDR